MGRNFNKHPVYIYVCVCVFFPQYIAHWWDG